MRRENGGEVKKKKNQQQPAVYYQFCAPRPATGRRARPPFHPFIGPPDLTPRRVGESVDSL